MNYEFLIIGYFFIKIRSFIPVFLIHDSAQSFTLACVQSAHVPFSYLLTDCFIDSILTLFACS